VVVEDEGVIDVEGVEVTEEVVVAEDEGVIEVEGV